MLSSSSDPYSRERELLSVAPGAEPEDLQVSYKAAVEAAKASTPKPLLPVKLAELGQALRTLSNAWTEEQLRALDGLGAGGVLAPGGSGSSGALGGDSLPSFLRGADLPAPPGGGGGVAVDASPSEAEADARAHRAMAAAKAYAARKGGNAEAEAGAEAVAVAGAELHPRGGGRSQEAVPEWVALGREIEAAWEQAVAGLRRPEASDAAAEERFRGAAAAINLDIERYNLMVPLARFQRGKKSEALLAKELEAARRGGSSAGNGIIGE